MNLQQINIPVKPARIFYGVALGAFGIQQFIFGFFIVGRPMPWPVWLPGESIVAYAVGALLIFTCITIIINKKAVEVLIAVAIIILLWAGLRNLFFIVTHLDYGGTLTNTGKALTLGSGALLVARTFTNKTDSSLKSKVLSCAFLCRYFTGFFLFASGVQHFIFSDFVKYLVPAWIPAPLFWTYFSGIALIAAGLSLITGIKANLAATLAGWMVFIWIFILHLPRAIGEANQNEWTAFFEAVAVSAILFLLSHAINNKTKS